MPLSTLLGAAFTIAAAIVAERYRALTRRGVITAVVIALALLATSWEAYLLTLLFFASSSLLTFFGYKEKEKRGACERKGGRTASQVICSGGVPAALSMLALLEHGWSEPLTIAVASTIAFACADTWAAELGSLSTAIPRLIVNPRKRVPHGVSGGITALGELGAALGALFIALPAAFLKWLGKEYGWSWSDVDLTVWELAVAVFVLGWLGEVMDSLLGAIIQPKFKCRRCGVIWDHPHHICGSEGDLVSGLSFVKNEHVNLMVELIIAVVALLISPYL